MRLDDSTQTLDQLARRHASDRPDEVAYIYLDSRGRESDRLTFGELDQKARAIAGELRRWSRPGQRVILAYPPGLEFVTAFFGSLYAGLIAVPVYPPGASMEWSRFTGIIDNCGAHLVCTNRNLVDRLQAGLLSQPALRGVECLNTDNVPPQMCRVYNPPRLDDTRLAFLQYTSGTTGQPKGVMVSHRNVLENQRMIQELCQHDLDSITVSWLPQYHDMGLIGHILHPFCYGLLGVLMAPITFLARPHIWLSAISEFGQRGPVTSAAPNFAYDLCVKRVSEQEKKGLDLSNWFNALSGSERICAETLDRFREAFAGCGFRRDRFVTCYGMAEATLAVSGHRDFEIRALDPEALANGHAEEATGGAAQRVVGCGVALSQTIRIVNPDSGRSRAHGDIGEVWVQGPNVAHGYWRRDDLNTELFCAYTKDSLEGPFLRTGDLGFFANGELTITGRLKDLIIIRGRNYYPEDIETVARSCDPALDGCRGAAFSIDVADGEGLVLIQEVNRQQLKKFSAYHAAARIRMALAAQMSVPLHDVGFVRQGRVPVTSSGKVQRQRCRQQYLAGDLPLDLLPPAATA